MTSIVKRLYIPRQIDSSELDDLESASDITEYTLKLLIVTTFSLSALLGGSLGAFWSMMIQL